MTEKKRKAAVALIKQQAAIPKEERMSMLAIARAAKLSAPTIKSVWEKLHAAGEVEVGP